MATGLRISDLGILQFTNETGNQGLGYIFVDSLFTTAFIERQINVGSLIVDQICQVITTNVAPTSSSPSAILELDSTSGALLLSRLTQTDINQLNENAPLDGMILYNTTAKEFQFRQNGAWTSGGGGGGAVSQITSTNGSLKITPDTGVGVVNIEVNPALSSSIVIADVLCDIEIPMIDYHNIPGVGYTLKQPLVLVNAAATTNLNGTYNNGPNDDGVGATLTGVTPGYIGDIDGVYVPAGSSNILVANNQTNGGEAGVYTITDPGDVGVKWILTRSATYNTDAVISPYSNTVIYIMGGATYAGKTYYQTNFSAKMGSLISNEYLVFAEQGAKVMDGVNIAYGHSSLLIDQSDKTQNGVYDFGPQLDMIPIPFVTTQQISPSYNNGPNNNGVGATLSGNGVLNINSTDVPLGQTVLVQTHTSYFANGIYTLTTQDTNNWVLTRTVGYDTPEKLRLSNRVFYTPPSNKEVPNKMYIIYTMVRIIGANGSTGNINFRETTAVGKPYQFVRSAGYNTTQQVNNNVISIAQGNQFIDTYWNANTRITTLGSQGNYITYYAAALQVSRQNVGGIYDNGPDNDGFNATILQIRIDVTAVLDTYNGSYNNGPNDDGVGATLTIVRDTLDVDGVIPVLNDLLLINYGLLNGNYKFHTNGVYKLTTVGSAGVPWVMTRLGTYDTPGQITSTSNTIIYVHSGTKYGGKVFSQSMNVVSIGTDDIRYIPYVPFTLNGKPPIEGQPVLFPAQNNQISNGIYVYSPNYFSVAAAADQNIPGTYNNGPNDDGVGATFTLQNLGKLYVDGQSISSSEKVLLFGQANNAYNGVYEILDVGSPTRVAKLKRPVGYDTPSTITSSNNTQIYVYSGVTYADTNFAQVNTVDTIGVSYIDYLRTPVGMGYGYIFTRGSYYKRAEDMAQNKFVPVLTQNILTTSYWLQTNAVTKVGVSPIIFKEIAISELFPDVTTNNLVIAGTVRAIGGPIIFPSVTVDEVALYESLYTTNGSVYYSLSKNALRVRVNNQWTTVANLT